MWVREGVWQASLNKKVCLNASNICISHRKQEIGVGWAEQLGSFGSPQFSSGHLDLGYGSTQEIVSSGDVFSSVMLH